mmetsp:Transcript_56811/g.116331  ORF Transcript_56811/g.116331 Transcript_56811/m.116331 type:complete len:244 (-) Transcript_56811:745-1476(-)
MCAPRLCENILLCTCEARELGPASPKIESVFNNGNLSCAAVAPSPCSAVPDDTLLSDVALLYSCWTISASRSTMRKEPPLDPRALPRKVRTGIHMPAGRMICAGYEVAFTKVCESKVIPLMSVTLLHSFAVQELSGRIGPNISCSLYPRSICRISSTTITNQDCRGGSSAKGARPLEATLATSLLESWFIICCNESPLAPALPCVDDPTLLPNAEPTLCPNSEEAAPNIPAVPRPGTPRETST